MPPKKEHKNFDNIEKKHCPTCDDWKILTDFTKQTSSWDKLCRMCRTCMISYKKNKRETNPKYKEKDIIYNEKYVVFSHLYNYGYVHCFPSFHLHNHVHC